MGKQTKKIKDFIYLDGDKLYSLYSQLNEGLANQIVQSRLKSEEQFKSQAGNPGEGSSNESKFSDLIHSTESKVLHDYMYSTLEDQLKSSIVDAADITVDNYQEILKNSFFVKVNGVAEITDYGRLKQIFDNVNEMGKGIAYMQGLNSLGMKVYELKSLVNKTKNKNDKEIFQKLLSNFEKPEELAKEMNLFQDEKQMYFFGYFAELFYLNEIEIMIKKKDINNNEINFRGILNKDWLRLKPEALRMLYAGLSNFNFSMVAQITHISSNENNAQSKIHPLVEATNSQSEPKTPEEVKQVIENTESANPKDTMRDSLLKMARATRDLENSFMTSGAELESVVSPLAIYRETEIKFDPPQIDS